MNYLTDEQLASYHRDGFVALPGLFSREEIDQYRDAAEALKLRVSPLEPGKPRLQIEPEKDDGAYCLRLVEPLIDLSPVFEELASDPRIMEPVQKILGEKALLFEDKINFKPPRTGSAFKLHQDQSYWNEFAQSIVSVFVHIDRSDLENGCLQVLPGLHRCGELTFTDDGPDHTISDDRVTGIAPLDMIMEEGDILIFSSFTPHASEANRSERVRRAIIYSYNPESEGNNYRYSEELLSSYH